VSEPSEYLEASGPDYHPTVRVDYADVNDGGDGYVGLHVGFRDSISIEGLALLTPDQAREIAAALTAAAAAADPKPKPRRRKA
jgi:hypothetical protein